MDAIVEHMIDRLGSIEAESRPFPHLFVTDFLPPDLYAELVQAMPSPDRYEDAGDSHHVDGRTTRTCFPLLDKRLNRWNEPAAELWRMVRDALCSIELQQAVFHLLRNGLAYRFRMPAEKACALRGFPSPTLFRETEGYRIAPHPDTRKKLVTMQLALPPDTSQQDLGTSLYRRSLTQLTKVPRGFATVKRFPFLPNSAYAFVVLNNLGKKSWHGREALRPEQGVRHTLLNIYGDKPNEFPSPFGEHDEQGASHEHARVKQD